jgi:hypothetical protein
MCPLDALQRARVERLRAQLTFARRRDLSAPSLSCLLGAARRLESLDAQLARATYLDALRAGIFAGKLLDAGELYEAAAAARTAPPGPNRPRAIDLLLDGLAVRFTDGHEAASCTAATPGARGVPPRAPARHRRRTATLAGVAGGL